MNCSYRIIPVYTGDVSGVCSALYELGGMVVIHDPSGCNSTYNTHDETRWYDKESLIFISGLSERDAILGNDKKLIDDVTDAARQLNPAFIALTNSPIPFMSGTDFPAIAHVIEKKTGIPTFFAPANGMHDYTVGAGNAFAQLAGYMNAKEEVNGKRNLPVSVNILGMTPLDFDAEDSVVVMEQMLRDAGFSMITCLGMGDTALNWKAASKADVNLVVSSVGLSLAKKMEKLFKIPYVVGTPIGVFAECVFENVRTAYTNRASRVAYMLDESGIIGETHVNFPMLESDKSRVIFVGEAVTMKSLATAFSMQTGIASGVICPLETYEGLLQDRDLHTQGEEEIENVFSQCGKGTYIVADPLYKPILPEGVTLIEFSHEAFSGRCFRRMRKQLVGKDSMILKEMIAAVR